MKLKKIFGTETDVVTEIYTQEEVKKIVEASTNEAISSYGDFKIRYNYMWYSLDSTNLPQQVQVSTKNGYTKVSVALNTDGTTDLFVKGYLKGSIVLGSATDGLTSTKPVVEEGAEEPLVVTTIDGVDYYKDDASTFGGATLSLEGLVIENTTDNVIEYAPLAKSLKIMLNKVDVENHIICKTVGEKVSGIGAIVSNNNLDIKGCGYLTISDKFGGHGFYCNELTITDNPHLYIDVKHDCLHGSLKNTIYGGYFYLLNGNDAVGTGDFGTITVYGGTFNANSIVQDLFDAKVSGVVYADKVKIVGATKGHSSQVVYVNSSNYQTIYGEGKVYSVTATSVDGEYLDAKGNTVLEDENGDIVFTEDCLIEAVDGVYTCGDNIMIEGYVNAQILLPLPKTSIILNHAYVTCGIENTPTIYYSAGSKSLEIKTKKGSGASFVEQTYVRTKEEILSNINSTGAMINSSLASNAILSMNNLKFQVKADTVLYITSKGDSGAYGSACAILKNNGDVYINGCADCGIRATEFYFGGEDLATLGEVKGSFYLTDNGSHSLLARVSSKGKKGTIDTINGQMLGSIIADSIEVGLGVDGQVASTTYLNDKALKLFLKEYPKNTTAITGGTILPNVDYYGEFSEEKYVPYSEYKKLLLEINAIKAKLGM